MPTHVRSWAEGGEFGTRYTFDNAGDGVRMHSHSEPATWHDTRCLRGKVAVYGDGMDAVATAGQTLTYPPFRQHEIAALEPDTEIVNVLYIAPETQYHEDTTVDVALMGRTDFTW